MMVHGFIQRIVLVLGLAWGLVAPLSAQEVARIEPLSVVTENSATLFAAEIADTDELRSRGLMFRHVLPQDRAMLFDFGEPRPAAMWMKR